MSDRILDSDPVTLYQDAVNEAFDQGGFTGAGTVRRGKSIIAAAETRSNAAYGLLTTPDRVQGIVLPTDGLIVVAYQATWQESVAGAGRAAVFIGANQLKVATSAIGIGTSGPAVQETQPLAAYPGADNLLFTAADGLRNQTSTAGGQYGGDVTTGQAIGIDTAGMGGACHIFAAAGTYDVSIQFKASSGSITAKNRKLWAWTLGF